MIEKENINKNNIHVVYLSLYKNMYVYIHVKENS